MYLDEVDGTAREANAGGERLTDRVVSLEARKKGGVGVEETATPLVDEGGRENAHEAGQTDQGDAGRPQRFVDLLFVLLAFRRRLPNALDHLQLPLV